MTEAQTGTIPTVGLSQADSDRLKQFYTFRDPERVEKFLEKHPFLVPLLLEAPAEIQHYFPGDELLLEAVLDPEAASLEDEELVLQIATNIEAEESIERLWKLDKAWWLNDLDRAKGKMFINLE